MQGGGGGGSDEGPGSSQRRNKRKGAKGQGAEYANLGVSDEED
jgi:hypothetical protein